MEKEDVSLRGVRTGHKRMAENRIQARQALQCTSDWFRIYDYAVESPFDCSHDDTDELLHL